MTLSAVFDFGSSKSHVRVVSGSGSADETTLIRATRYTGSDKWHLERQRDSQGFDIAVTPEIVRMLANAMDIMGLFDGKD